MTSFFEQAMRTATRIKEQVDELRGAGAAATDATPADPRGLGAHERGVVEHAIARGAPDPFELLAAEEAAAVLGAPVGRPSLAYSDDATGVRFAADGSRGATSSLSALVYHGADETDGDGPGYWRDVVLDAYGDAERVARVGEEAIWSPPYLFVLDGGTVFHVEATTPAGADDARDRARAAAEIVAARLAAR